MIEQSSCEHLSGKPDFEVLLVVDSQIQLMEALVKCRQCAFYYLIEALDIASQDTLFRIAKIPADHAVKTARSIDNGSCNLKRATEEIAYLKSLSKKCDKLLISEAGQFTATIDIENLDEVPPSTAWRELPFDGRWFNKIRRAAGIC